MRINRLTIGIVCAFAGAGLLGCSQKPEVTYDRPPVRPSPEQRVESSIASDTSTSSETSVQFKSVRSVLIKVPFTIQAPFADWEAPYQEACEEASLIMVHHYLQHSTLSKEQADREILDLIAWEGANGFSEDVYLAELRDIAQRYYGYQTRIINVPSITDIESFVAQGFPVILPMAGRDLGNPYFSGEGPWYHMLVVIGFNERDFITNDPGTRRGEHYSYRKEVLMSAIHDWTGIKEEIRKGVPKALVVMPNESGT